MNDDWPMIRRECLVFLAMDFDLAAQRRTFADRGGSLQHGASAAPSQCGEWSTQDRLEGGLPTQRRY
ncbi:hypothetical protein [Flindersiella endophytica]